MEKLNYELEKNNDEINQCEINLEDINSLKKLDLNEKDIRY